MSLLREIQNELVSAKGDITNILRKCKILAARLGSEELARWVDWELNGYPSSQVTPGYRRLGARCYASFINIAWKIERQPVLWEVLPEPVRPMLQSIEFRDGIAKANAFGANGARIERPDVAVRLQGKMYPEMTCFAAWLEISHSEVEQLLSAVRNRILDLVLKIEAENPEAGEAQLNSRPVPSEKLQQLVHNAFYGPVGSIAQSSEHFSQIASIGIPVQDLTKLVRDMTEHLDELSLDVRQKQRAEAQIATLAAELRGDPDPTIVRQAASTLRNVTEGAIGSLLATALQPSVWHWIHQTLTSLGKP